MALTFVTYGTNPTLTPPQDEPTADEEPISLDEAKLQVRREDVNDDDEYILSLIPPVRERAEQATRRQIVPAVWDYRLDGFPCGDEAIVLPLPPLQSVYRIQYVDTAGVTQTWDASNYVVDAPTGPRAQRGRIALAYGATWPVTRDQINAVTIRFVAGYDTVPPRLRLGMLLDLGSWFENREDQVIGQGYVVSEFPMGVQAIYRAFKSRA